MNVKFKAHLFIFSLFFWWVAHPVRIKKHMSG